MGRTNKLQVLASKGAAFTCEYKNKLNLLNFIDNK